MKGRAKRYFAMLLVMTLVLQQGSAMGALAGETEPASETVTEKTVEPQSAAIEEKADDEKKQEESKEPDTKAVETKSEETGAPETANSETKSEDTKESQTQLTENAQGETQPTQTEAGTNESEKNTEASEPTTQTEGTTEGMTQVSSGQESESEEMTDTESEKLTEAAAELDIAVVQEVFQRTVDNAHVPMVKYIVKLSNKAETADAEGVSLKVLLADALFYKKEEGETSELVSFGTLGNAMEAAAFENGELDNEDKTAYANGGVVIWKNQTIAAGEDKTFVFFAEVKDGENDVNALRNLWFVNGKAVAEEKLQWAHTELLEVKPEQPSEYTVEDGNMIVTAMLAEGTVLPEGAQFVVEKVELSDEEKAQVEAAAAENKQLANYVAYDMHFEVDGEEVEPQGEVAVKVEYKEANAEDFGGETLNADAAELQVIHLDEQAGAEDVTAGAEVGADGAVSSAEFVTDSFSVFVLSQMVDVDRTFVYEDDDVKITAVAGEEEELLNSNLTELKLEIVEDRDSKEYKELEKAIEKKEKDTGFLLGLRAYKLSFLKDGEEIEPTDEIEVTIKHKTSSIPDYIPENYVSETVFYQVAPGKKAEALDAELKSGRNNSVKEAVMTITGTMLVEVNNHEGTPQSRADVLGRLGFAQNFAVFAIDFENNNHMEGSIAVQNLNGSSSQIGNTDAVSQHNHSTTVLEIQKNANGPNSSNATYRFGIFTKDSEGKYQLVTETGNDGIVEVKTDETGFGSVIVDDLPAGTYYVFELNDSKQPILPQDEVQTTVNGQTVTVKYTGETTDNSVIAGSVGNKSYIEYFKKPGGESTELFNNTNTGKAAVVIGSTNKIEDHENQSCKWVVGSDGSKYLVNLDKTVIEQAGGTFPINFTSEMGKLSALSCDLAGVISTGELKVVYLPVKADGSIDKEKACVDGKYPFKDDPNAWDNSGLSTEGKLLVLNVDCTNAPTDVTVKGMKIDGQDPQNWSDIANSVIWNFYTGLSSNASAYTGKITYEGGLGTILAPNATVSCTSSTNGSVIGNKVDHPSCEIHHIKLIETSTTTTKRLACWNTAEETGKAKVVFSGTKSVEGIERTQKEFTFELYETKDDYKIEKGAEPLQTQTRKGAGHYSFKPIYYDEESTHYYVVKEKMLDAPEGFTVDETEYHIQVAVALDATGKLAATSTVSGKEGTSPTIGTLNFCNTYKAAETSVTLGGTKRVEGVESTDKEFTFELYETDEDYKTEGKEVLQSVTVTGPKPYTFTAIPFDKEGIYHYVVKEKASSTENGFLVDKTVYRVQVIVQDNGKGKLLYSVSVMTEDGKSAKKDTLDFTNKALTGTVSLDAKKEMAEPTEKLGTYEFEVLDKDSKTLKTAKNDATGKIAFGDIAAYTLSDIGKTFTYTVKEKVSTTTGGIIYDKTIYTVTVGVTADEKTGGPKATVTRIEKDGTTAPEIKFINDETHLNVLKVDESGAALSGAKLIIKDAAGNPVNSWTTDGKAHEITGLAKGAYTLSELEAPEGYQVSKDMPFEITGNETKDAVLTVKMTDKKVVETKRSLRVTKQLRLDGISPEANIIVRAATYYVALFEDEARTQRISDVKKIVFENEASSYATFNNLEADKTYYIGETDENGTLIPGGRLSPRMIYYPIYDKEATFKFEGDMTEGLAGFTNVYVELPDNFYLAGQLTVTKKVLVNGEKANSDDVFYAGVFADAGLRQLVGNVLTLDMAGGSETSVTVTNLTIGNTPGSSRKYYVAETDENGIPLDPDVVTEYTISVDKSEVTLSGYDPNQAVVITNSFTEEEESEFESELESESETEVSKKTAPKTGDDTNFMKYLFLMALSAGLGGIAVGQKRRKAKRARK